MAANGSSRVWALQDAKNRLSELVRDAQDDGPQTITIHGRETVVVVAAAEYERLRRRPRGSLTEFLQRSPLAEATLDLTRDHDTGRDTSL